MMVLFAIFFTTEPDAHYIDTITDLFGVKGLAIVFGIFPIYVGIKSLFTGTLHLGGEGSFHDRSDEYLSWREKPILTFFMFVVAIALGLGFISIGIGLFTVDTVIDYLEGSQLSDYL